METLDYIIKYTEYESSIPKSKSLQSFLFLSLLVGIPTSIFGVKAELTKYLFLPLIVIYSVWTIYLMFKTDSKKNQFVLYLGMSATFFSILFAVAAYKFAWAFMQVQTKVIIFLTFAYLLINIVTLLFIKRLIKKGFFSGLRKSKNPMGIITMMSVLGLSIGRSLRGVSSDTGVTILITCLLILSILSSVGAIHNLLRYYYICKLKKHSNVSTKIGD